MSETKQNQIKERVREAFINTVNNYPNDPELIWKYLLAYRSVLGENEHI